MTETRKFYCMVCDTTEEVPVLVVGGDIKDCENCGYPRMRFQVAQKTQNKIIKWLKFWKRKGD